MRPNRELDPEEYRQRVLRARAMSPEEKIAEGFRLYVKECEEMAASIRREFPEADERRVREILNERLDTMRRLEEGDLYQPYFEREARSP